MRKEIPIFVHLGKTGGLSIVDAIERVYVETERISVYPDDTVQHSERLGVEYLSRAVPQCFVDEAKIIYGHVPTTFADALGVYGRHCTILRHPVTRSISEYTYRKRELDPLNWDKVTLEDFLTDIPPFIENYMTRTLAGDRSDVAVTEKTLDLACRRLDEMPVVGIHEYFEESFKRIASFLGLSSSPSHSNKSRVSAHQVLLDENPSRLLMAKLSEANALDIALYEHAKSLFAKQAKQTISSFYPTARKTGSRIGSAYLQFMLHRDYFCRRLGKSRLSDFHNGIIIEVGARSSLVLEWNVELLGVNMFELKYEAHQDNECCCCLHIRLVNDVSDELVMEKKTAIGASTRGAIQSPFIDPRGKCKLTIATEPFNSALLYPLKMYLSAGIFFSMDEKLKISRLPPS